MNDYFEKLQIILAIITLIVGGVIGYYQIKINSRLISLEDYVSISAVPIGNKIKLLNTGKINLYLWGFDMPGNNYRFPRPRLISANTGDSSFYWIDPPKNLESLNGMEFEFKLYLIDEFNKKWISEAGGRVDKIEQKENEKDQPKYQIILWSYKTYKKDWTMK